MKSKFVGTNQYSNKTMEERFWEKVDIRGEDECWEWQANRDKKGYGKFRVKNPEPMTTSNRVAWNLVNGSIPEGLFVLHKCDNPPCCNPKHLFLGTNQDNMDDKVKKGRSVKGSNHPKAKLSEMDIPKIRNLISDGISYAEIGRMFGVNHWTIKNISINKSWRSVA